MTRVLLYAVERNRVRVEFAPEFGGALANVSFGGVPILRPWNGEPHVRRMAIYPLLPCAIPIAKGGFVRRARALQGGSTDQPHAVQGVAWQRAWRFEAHGHEARMRLRHRPNGEGAQDWPFALDAEQVISVTEDGIALALKVHNLAPEPVSVGLGWHPFFPRHDGVYVSFLSDTVRARNGEPTQDRCMPPPESGGTAEIAWPGQGIALQMRTSPELGDLVATMPAAPADFFALEPIARASKPAGAGARGLRILSPGESLSVAMSLTVKELT